MCFFFVLQMICSMHWSDPVKWPGQESSSKLEKGGWYPPCQGQAFGELLHSDIRIEQKMDRLNGSLSAEMSG